jgi:hypothetical protein
VGRFVAPASAMAAARRVRSRNFSVQAATTVVNRVGAAGFIGFGIFAFVHGLMT